MGGLSGQRVSEFDTEILASIVHFIAIPLSSENNNSGIVYAHLFKSKKGRQSSNSKLPSVYIRRAT